MENLTITPADRCILNYLESERPALDKHELRDRKIIEMPRWSFYQSLINANFVGELGQLLKHSPFSMFESSLRLCVPSLSFLTYPAASIVKGKPKLLDSHNDVLLNPILLAEVLSPTTEAYDRGEKFSRYRQLDSLEEYVLINQHAPRVETFFRQPDGTWLLTVTSGLDASAHFRSLSVSITLAEIYASVEFPPAPEPVAEA